MILDKLTDILAEMPNKTQKRVLSCVDFKNNTPHDVYTAMIKAMQTLCRNATQRAKLDVIAEYNPTDEEVLAAFGPTAKGVGCQSNLTFTDEQISYIKRKIYRNREGNFRLIPADIKTTVDKIPIDGLDVDEKIIANKLKYTKINENGTEETFNGLQILQGLEYDGSEEDNFKSIDCALRRVDIDNDFTKPFGFYRTKNNSIRRNVACMMKNPIGTDHTDKDLERAMFLIYLTSGATIESWQAMYKVIHNMVRNPNSHTGIILYLNDFESGGNGKSKLVKLLQEMFNDSFTAFSTQQLRFTMNLLGKRLVSIAEFENAKNTPETMNIIKQLTGRDSFEYEAKNKQTIVARSYQNFVITSNRYVMFDDKALCRRLQNFQCSNLLNLITTKYTKIDSYLNKLFGNEFDSSSIDIERRMGDALLEYVMADNNAYHIPIRPQPVVLSSLKNPILRALFAKNVQFDNFIRPDVEKGTSAIDLWRMSGDDGDCNGKHHQDIRPEQMNYATRMIEEWIPDIEFTVARDSTSMSCNISDKELISKLKARLDELDKISRHLKSKTSVVLERGEFAGFNTEDMIQDFLGDTIKESKIPYTKDGIGNIIIGNLTNNKINKGDTNNG